MPSQQREAPSRAEILYGEMLILCADCLVERFDPDEKLFSAEGSKQATTIIDGRALCIGHLYCRLSAGEGR